MSTLLETEDIPRSKVRHSVIAVALILTAGVLGFFSRQLVAKMGSHVEVLEDVEAFDFNQEMSDLSAEAKTLQDEIAALKLEEGADNNELNKQQTKGMKKIRCKKKKLKMDYKKIGAILQFSEFINNKKPETTDEEIQAQRDVKMEIIRKIQDDKKTLSC